MGSDMGSSTMRRAFHSWGRMLLVGVLCVFLLRLAEHASAESNNQYLDPQHQGLLESAKALLENGGSLSEAALMLEAAIQKGQLGEGGYEAWILLGETRNMDEREEAGMRALTEGVARGVDAGAAGVGMLVRVPVNSFRVCAESMAPESGDIIHKRILRKSLTHDASPLAPRPLPVSSRSSRNHRRALHQRKLGHPRAFD
jgi:hypothetical protein